MRPLSLALLLCLPVTAQAPDPLMEQAVTWHDARELGIEGQGWTGVKHPFDRLPAKAEGVVRPPVWTLSQDSAGMRVRFVTDSKWIRARWTVRRERLAMQHMPASGVSGIDLYVRDGGEWKWLAAGHPMQKQNDKILVRGLRGERRDYLLYLPLYNGTETLELGVPQEAKWEKAAPDSRKPIVFYGTSILHGGCASRPGMAYPSIIGRKLDWPTINLGFSGNGKTEPEMAALLAELDPAAYVLDSLPNLSPEETARLVEPFYRALRKAHPKTPIFFVEHVFYTEAEFVERRKTKYSGDNAALKEIFGRVSKEGDKLAYYIPGDDLLGRDGEGTVDGTHPTDLGFMRMADVIAPRLHRVLKETRNPVGGKRGR